eukprot:SAG22_NODE_101_length_20519_cov_15.588002_6_plen_408_part_00
MAASTQSPVERALAGVIAAIGSTQMPEPDLLRACEAMHKLFSGGQAAQPDAGPPPQHWQQPDGNSAGTGDPAAAEGSSSSLPPPPPPAESSAAAAAALAVFGVESGAVEALAAVAQAGDAGAALRGSAARSLRILLDTVPKAAGLLDAAVAAAAGGGSAVPGGLDLDGLIVAAEEQAAAESAELTPAQREHWEQTVAGAPVVLFMKGLPAAPRCGFSRKAVELLRAAELPFTAVDVLAAEDTRRQVGSHACSLASFLASFSGWPVHPSGRILPFVSTSFCWLRSLGARVCCTISIMHACGMPRMQVKLFSDWPTFPQLFASGELVGGVDILLELAEVRMYTYMCVVPGANSGHSGLLGMLPRAQKGPQMVGAMDHTGWRAERRRPRGGRGGCCSCGRRERDQLERAG